MSFASCFGHNYERNNIDRYNRNDYDYITEKNPPLIMRHSPNETKTNEKYLEEMFHKEWDISNCNQFNNTKHKQLNNTIKNKGRNEVAIKNKQINHKKAKFSKQQLSALSKMKAGQVCKGKVKNIKEYGAFIDLGFIDGLMHKSKMSRWKDNHPDETIYTGDTIEVIILSIDYKSGWISLEMKQKCNHNQKSKAKKKKVKQ